MNILYFNPSSTPGAKRKIIADRCHDIVSTGIQADALRLIHNRSFDAVVIENEDEDVSFSISPWSCTGSGQGSRSSLQTIGERTCRWD